MCVALYRGIFCARPLVFIWLIDAVFTVVVLWQNYSPRQLFKFLLSLYHQMHECFEGPLMSKYLRTSSIQGFERLWIWGNMNPSFFKFPPPPPRPKMFSLPMSSPPPSFIIYQNISPLIKPHGWVFQYIFIFSSLRMQSAQDSEWLRST